jgi:tetratricopeptide (TPR) repeat protein
MNFFKNLFSKTKDTSSEFAEGDIFYCLFDEKYHLYKVLKVDNDFPTYHVLCYQPLDKLPNIENISGLDILVYHSPIAKTGFEGATFFSKSIIKNTDLVGYYEYLRQTDNTNELAKIANSYYKEGYRLTDLQRHKDAIDEYTKAIEVFPTFYEAIDNRAFCKMDLALYDEAIEDFQLSLTVNKNSFLAIFSIGECHLRLSEFEKAKEYFEYAQKLDPTNKHVDFFLKKAVNKTSI